MNVRAVFVATSNSGKLAMFQEWFSRRGIAVRQVDPGDAEELAEIGYETAAQAKVNAIEMPPLQGSLILAHDSGFEYESLDGAPGPMTKSWLRAMGWQTHPPEPGSKVTVVHAIAARIDDRNMTFFASDTRIVVSNPKVDGDDLPLGHTTSGPKVAFHAALDNAYRWATE